MKKKLVSFILAVLMFVSCFTMTSCGNTEKKTDNSSSTVGTTLTMWLPAAKGSEIDEESVINVERAINEYTQKNFTTAVKLKVFPAEKYDEYVLSKIYQLKLAEDIAREEAQKARKEKHNKNNTDTAEATTEDVETVNESTESAAESAAESADETAAESADTEEANSGEIDIGDTGTDPNDYIIPADENEKRPYDYDYDNFGYLNASLFTSFPAVEDGQFDIFLIHGFDEFKLLYDDMLLSDLTSNVNNQSKKMLSYINPEFMQGALYDSGYSFIPNNRPVGETEVMIINNDVCEQLYYDPAEFDSVDKLFSYDNSGVSFIEDVKKSLPNVAPVAGELTAPNIEYYGTDKNSSFSVISALVANVPNFSAFAFQNVFKNTNFINSYKNVKRIRDISASANIETVGEFAVGFFKGTYDKIAEYKNEPSANDPSKPKYSVITLQAPQLQREDVYKTGFAVSYYTKNADRAMQIINAINTDTELRTILQYGMKDVNWRYDIEDSNVIRILNDKYKMDIEETGNVFVTYPGEGKPISDWDEAKENNLNLYIPYTFGFEYVTAETSPLLREIDAKSKDIKQRIDAMSYAEFNNNIESLKKEVDDMESFQKLTYVFYVDTEKDLEMVEEESLWMLLNDYVQLRGWTEQ